MSLLSRHPKEPTPYTIVDRGIVIPLTTAQRDKLLGLEMIYLLPDDDANAGWYGLEAHVSIADVDFVL